MTRPVAHPSMPWAVRPVVSAVLLAMSGVAWPLPQLGSNPGGGITTSTANNVLTVTQAQNKPVAELLWTSFSINSNERVNFIQPDGSALILNRITGQNPSTIMGQLQANGRIVLINPNGIVFSAGSVVNTGALLATTLGLEPGSNLGNRQLSLGGNGGSIEVHGNITTADLALIAPQISVGETARINANGTGAQVQLIAAGSAQADLSGNWIALQVVEGVDAAFLSQLGQIRAPEGTITLLARSQPDGQVSTLNTAGVLQASQITLRGDQISLGATEILGDIGLQAAGNISQTGQVSVDGNAALTASRVNLNRSDNSFDGLVTVQAGNATLNAMGALNTSANVTGQLDVQSTGNLIVTGNAGTLLADSGQTLDLNTLSAGRIQAEAQNIELNSVSTTGNVSLEATGNISQTGQVSVDGNTALTASRVNLNRSDNSFDGLVTVQAGNATLNAAGALNSNVNVTGQLDVQSTGNLTVTGNAGTLLADSGQALSLNSLSANRLQAEAQNIALNSVSTTGNLSLEATGNISQTGQVSVDGNTALTASRVNLNRSDNSFDGLVTVQSGNATLNATGALNTSANVTGQLDVQSTGNLTVSGASGTLLADSGQTLNLNNVNANRIQAEAQNIALNSVSTTGNLSLEATGNIGQTGQVAFGGNAALAASQVTLNRSDNSFAGLVSVQAGNATLNAAGALNSNVNVTGQLDIQSTGNLSVTGSAGTLLADSGQTLSLNSLSANRIQAEAQNIALNSVSTTGNLSLEATGNIGQTGQVSVDGNTALTASRVNLSRSDNSFDGLVTVQAGNATLNATGALNTSANVNGQLDVQSTGNLIVTGNAGTLLADSGQTLSLNGLTANRIQAEAQDIALNSVSNTGNLSLEATGNISQTGQVSVDGNTALTASRVNLNRSDNSFDGLVTVQAGNATVNATGELNTSANVTDQLDVQSTGNLIVTGNAGTLLADSGQTLNLNNINANSIQAEAQNIALNSVNTTGNLALEATGNISQNGQVAFGGNAALAASQVTLNRSDNSFDGLVTVQAGNATLNATGELNTSANVNGQLDVQSTGNLTVRGTTSTLLADSGQILNLNNVNANRIQAEAQNIALNSVNTTGNLSLEATGNISQTGQVAVDGNTALTASRVNLNRSDNSFDGLVTVQAGNATLSAAGTLNSKVNVTGQLDIQSTGNLTVTGSAGDLVASSGQTLSLNNFIASSIPPAVQNALNLASTNVSPTADAAGGNDQTRTVAVNSNTTLTASPNNLNTSGNSFDGLGMVWASKATVNNTGSSSANTSINLNAQPGLSSSENLPGTTVDTNPVLNGSPTLNIQSASAGGIRAMAQNIALNSVSTTGNVSLEATGNISQTGQVAFGGNAALAASQVTLNRSDNSFAGLVTVQAGNATLNATGALNTSANVTGQLDVQSTGNMTVSGNSGMLLASTPQALVLSNLNIVDAQAQAQQVVLNNVSASGNLALEASGNISQSGAVRVDGQTTLSAEQVVLTNSDNALNGLVKVAAQALDLRSETLLLDTLNLAGNLSLNAGSIDQQGAWAVAGTTRLQGGNVNLTDAGNALSGPVVLNSGDVTIQQTGDLQVQGSARTLNLSSAGRLGQSGALTVDAASMLDANTIDLSNTDNRFGGPVTLSASASARIGSTGALDLRANDTPDLTTLGSSNQTIQTRGVHNLNAQGGTVTLNVTDSIDTLTVNSTQLRQQSALKVNGDTVVNTDQLVLTDTGNDFVGLVQVQAGNVALTDKNSLKADIHADGPVQLSAQTVAQEAAWQIAGTTQLTADTVTLNNSGNQFGGAVGVKAQNATLNTGSSLTLGASQVGQLQINAASVAQTGAVQVTGEAQIQAGSVVLDHSNNDFQGRVTLTVNQPSTLVDANRLDVAVVGDTSLSVISGGDLQLTGDRALTLGDTRVGGQMTVQAQSLAQSGRLVVQDVLNLNLGDADAMLNRQDNRLRGGVTGTAGALQLTHEGDLRVKDLTLTRGGVLEASERVLLDGRIQLEGGRLDFVARGIPEPLSAADLAAALPKLQDVYSGKSAVNPLTGTGRLAVASAQIDQLSGAVLVAPDAKVHFVSTQNGSIFLNRDNRIEGSLSAVTGVDHTPFRYDPSRGLSLFSVSNEPAVVVNGMGVNADMVNVRAGGLATRDGGVIRARLPYNDALVGAAASYPAFTLAIPVLASGNGVSPRQVSPFGAGASSQFDGSGAIAVEIGTVGQPGLGGFTTVLPFEGASLVPGQVVFLSGPENSASYAFYYDGAGSLTRVPVSYNGSVALSPQEASALSNAQGSAALARQEQTRSVVRTENVENKVIQGVVAEVGPGRPATEGTGELSRPQSCEGGEQGLTCSN